MEIRFEKTNYPKDPWKNGIFAYMKTIKINYSCRQTYNRPMDLMGYKGCIQNTDLSHPAFCFFPHGKRSSLKHKSFPTKKKNRHKQNKKQNSSQTKKMQKNNHKKKNNAQKKQGIILSPPKKNGVWNPFFNPLWVASPLQCRSSPPGVTARGKQVSQTRRPEIPSSAGSTRRPAEAGLAASGKKGDDALMNFVF